MPDFPVAVADHAETIKRAGEYIETAVHGGPGDFEHLIQVFDSARALLVGLRQAEERNERLTEALRRLVEVGQDYLREEYPTGTMHEADAEAARLERALAAAVLAVEEDTHAC